METIELTHHLDYHVAKAKNKTVEMREDGCYILVDGELERYSPSTSWYDGGKIIEEEKISLFFFPDNTGQVCAHIFNKFAVISNDPLVAAMRCFISLKLGEVADIVHIC